MAGSFYKLVGLSGTFAANIEISADSKLEPTVFLATTLNLYVLPAVTAVV